jgi:hypothetical protein
MVEWDGYWKGRKKIGTNRRAEILLQIYNYERRSEGNGFCHGRGSNVLYKVENGLEGMHLVGEIYQRGVAALSRGAGLSSQPHLHPNVHQERGASVCERGSPKGPFSFLAR